MSTGLSGRLAALDKNHPEKPARERPARPAAEKPARKARPSSAKVMPKAGANRTITVRYLTADDLKRLGEFRYTHNMNVQDIAIKGISMFLESFGLAPLSALADPDPTPEE
ncbi:hypothetical protein EAT51_19910 [Pseudoxanthomonas winnipegensis]|uniref:hypothetical protein n=1 Tax=Pseudoxanthomonas winnipegensis TaxID=2480810 RepID=UPI00102DC6C8|nr:hypothetical protein [Pseudoxanthomonas winnipegensis]TAA36405.1 hypothetical protein EAT51_19910 [Pseudoxanthomonas winnipegensis]